MSDEAERIARAKRAIRVIALRTDAGFGRLAERFAKANPKKARVPSATRTAKYRIPDVLTDTELVEIKNVQYQAMTNQLKDFLTYCAGSNRRLVLCIRDDARLSAEITSCIERGEIELRPVGAAFSQRSRDILAKIVAPELYALVEAARSRRGNVAPNFRPSGRAKSARRSP